MPKYLFEDKLLTCVSLEVALGLRRGDIVGMEIDGDRTVEIETKVPLTTAKQEQTRSILAGRGLVRGKRGEKQL